ncbi:alpha/beta hydrolase [Chromobacterium vaccinii]|uniref:alpha/beta hydrolase n=1 Tax=Chromobacterium vaccinii TaxID=1108595 RepID=UPI001E4A3BF8|nr:alpha/beta hydrolase [Chromobacterium vaccinii]MCD4484643.1 alpha/beta hydrolase [Chromobacterium vaccinii]
MSDYVMSVRAVDGDAFTASVGETRFLLVPDGQNPAPSQAIPAAIWFDRVRQDAMWSNNDDEPRGDVLFVVHGYNMDAANVMDRHRRLRGDLEHWGFKGVLVSFDWPSGNKVLAYLPDRCNAKQSAFRLVSDGIGYLSAQQSQDCVINVHVLGHSTGALVIREAFDDADDNHFQNMAWLVSQVVFAAGDVSAASMSRSDGGAESVYRHCVQLTNYFNHHDMALDLSNVKRVGLAPRVGREGLPADAPPKAVNVDCTAYYQQLAAPGSIIAATDQTRTPPFVGEQSHSWFFGNRTFARDLFCVLIGQSSHVIPTRLRVDGEWALRHV